MDHEPIELTGISSEPMFPVLAFVLIGIVALFYRLFATKS